MNRPVPAPAPNCIRSTRRAFDTTFQVPVSPVPAAEMSVATCISTMVSMYAIGSLLPLSSSRIGLRLFFRFTFLPLSRLNTAAESVEDIVAAISRQVTRGRAIGILSHPEIRYTNPPVRAVVNMTPIVDRASPGARTGFISLILVSRPPVNRMTHNATIPTNCACRTLSNCRPRPSLPNSIPTRRKSRRDGSPKRKPALLMRMLVNIRIEPTKSRFSEVK